MALEIKIKYFNPEMPKIEKLEIGDWVDLRAAETVQLTAGTHVMIPLGVAMKLPPGFEAIIVPRSSSFKKWGVLQTNGVGVVDESYCGDEDQWWWTVWCTRDAPIEAFDRICQFRIQQKQPNLIFIETQTLGKSRGGFGSTGTK